MSTPAAPPLVAVLDMGASAIRLVVAEVPPNGPARVLEEASRGVSLGRDTFATGAVRRRTIDAAVAALEGFRQIIDGYGGAQVKAVTTSAVREARNGDMLLDRIQRLTGFEFDVINEAEESRLVYLAIAQTLRRHAALRGARTLLAEVGGGSTVLTVLRHGEPQRSGVYGLGAVRMRQQLDLRRHTHDVQVALLKRFVANIIEEIRFEIPLKGITHMIAIGGDIRFAASQIAATDSAASDREISRDAFLAFCDQVETLDEEQIVERFRLPPVDAETLVPALLVYRTLVSDTAVRRIVVSDASLRAGILAEIAAPSDRGGRASFERQVLASAESLGRRFRFDAEHGQHVAALATRMFDELVGEHGLGHRERLILQVAALLHDIGVYISLRAHHKHSQYILAASQIFGLSDEETAIVANVARYHRRGMPQNTHLPYIALDRGDRLTVNKLAAILRVANALDAEHAQKVRDVRIGRDGTPWVLEIEATGDTTMEQLAAAARADMFEQAFGHQLTVRYAVIPS